MEPNKSDRYHDYVFKDGVFVGAFDDMYTYSKEIPWHQDAVALSWHSKIGVLLMQDLVKKRASLMHATLEIGCGLGYMSEQFSHFTKKMYGCDISRVAVDKARTMYSDIDFFTCDIRDPNLKITQQYDCIIMVDVIWYILDALDVVKKNVLALLSSGGFLLFKQSFPDLTQPFIGKDIFPNPERFAHFWSELSIANQCILTKVDGSLGPHIWIVGEKK
jgi:predicted TPR repeat methyltransferase